MSAITLIARKETGELLKSGRGIAWLLALSAILSVLGLLLVSNTELGGSVVVAVQCEKRDTASAAARLRSDRFLRH